MEAALIYPMVIIISVVMITAAVFYFEVCRAYCDMDKDLRRSAGTEKSTIQYQESEDSDSDEVHSDDRYELSEAGILLKNITGNLEMTFKGGLSLKREDITGTRVSRSEVSEIDAVIAVQEAKGFFNGS